MILISNRVEFPSVYQPNNPRGMLREILKVFGISRAKGNSSTSFSSTLQHVNLVITLVNGYEAQFVF